MKKKNMRRLVMDLRRFLPLCLLGLLTLLTLFMLCAQLLLHIPAVARHVSPIGDMEGWPLEVNGS
ncbi:hypothetical protein OIN60_07790 [Paenibacillus sp. P96]|uniref:Uncharacterized protein n=1 Tax=Paenibacillus zeirhizosphaerae TaxID=2987519 RepID=A0ABT9FPL4_9BACL|nr:hypothetical protein [Paenibacillus sp. P96]MDP4096670.1 hypothetical protein [Paenibacillus sp. P96]